MPKNIDEAVEKYIALRDAKTEMERKHKQALEPISEAMSALEDWLFKELNRLQAENIKTKHGTVYKTTKRSYKITDWAGEDGALPFIIENELWHFLEKRVNKTAMDEYLESNGELLPGVEQNAFIKIGLRKS